MLYMWKKQGDLTASPVIEANEWVVDGTTSIITKNIKTKKRLDKEEQHMDNTVT